MEAIDIDKYLTDMGWTMSKDSMEYAWLKQAVDISFKAGYDKCNEIYEPALTELMILSQKQYITGIKAGEKLAMEEVCDLVYEAEITMKLLDSTKDKGVGLNYQVQALKTALVRWQAFLREIKKEAK